jgi:N-formylglutamate amidohydrolase
MRAGRSEMTQAPSPRVVIHVPHASTDLPDAYRAQFGISDEDLVAEIHDSADLLTDLLARASWPGAQIIKAEVSRVLLDVERYADDEQEEMSRVGRGVIYTHNRFGQSLQRTISSRDRALLLDRFYYPHWQRLRKAAAGAVLIDLHTYPVAPWPIEPQAVAARPEIDLGTSPGLTPPSWTEALRDHFERQGFTVAENAPYAGVIDAGANAAIMIEIRRDMLGVGPRSDKWSRLQEALGQMPIPNILTKGQQVWRKWRLPSVQRGRLSTAGRKRESEQYLDIVKGWRGKLKSCRRHHESQKRKGQSKSGSRERFQLQVNHCSVGL